MTENWTLLGLVMPLASVLCGCLAIGIGAFMLADWPTYRRDRGYLIVISLATFCLIAGGSLLILAAVAILETAA